MVQKPWQFLTVQQVNMTLQYVCRTAMSTQCLARSTSSNDYMSYNG